MNIKELINKYPLLLTLISSILNIVYGVFNLYLGINTNSYWYITIAIFFLLLGISRLLVSILGKIKEKMMMRLISFIMFILSIVIAVITYISIVEEINPIRNIIIVLIQAIYAFSLIIIAIYNLIISHSNKDNKMIMIRNISLAGAHTSILSLERVMLGTFGGVGTDFNIRMEAYSGGFVFILLLVFILHNV